MTPINTTNVTQTNADFETQNAGHATAINVPPPPKNEVQQFEGSAPPPQTQGPASYARDTTRVSSTGYAASPEPQDAKAAQDAKQFVKDLGYITSIPNQDPFGVVGSPSRAWLQAVVNDPFRSQESKDVAKRLLASDVWGRADADNNGRISLGEASAYADKLGSKSAASSTGATGSTTAANADADVTTASAGGASASDAPKKTYPSTLDGSVAGLYDAQTSLQDKLTELSKEAASSPEKASQLQGQISLLTNQLQVLNNMTQMLQNLISNTAKMWNDIAMNAVRNIR